MAVYAVGVSVVLFFAWFYVWERLIETAELAQPLRQIVLSFFVLAYLLQAARWALYKVKGDLSWIIGPAYFAFGLLSHLLLATLLKDGAYLVWWLLAPESFAAHEAWWNSWVSYVIFFAGLALNLWGAQTAYEGPEIKKVKVPLSPSSTHTLKIAQISDLHVGPIIKEKYVRDVVSRVMDLEADLICITGDLGDGFPQHLKEDLAPLAKLKAPLGVFYITGNHEYYWNVDAWIGAVKSLGFQILFNSGVLLKTSAGRPVWLAGVPDKSAWRIRKDHVHDVKSAFDQAPTDAARILLAHQPASIYEAHAESCDLMLSGHTHGGQYFPFTLMVDWFNPYSKGLALHRERTWVYVNTGTGFWGPPLRLGVLSEITLLEVQI